MPYFLGPYDLYRTIQKELPFPAYPDSGSASAFYSTSDSYATAEVIADYYLSQQVTYNNYFAITATGANGRQSDHEVTWFGYQLDASLSSAQRLQILLAQIRKQPAPTLWNILLLALTYVAPGVAIQIAAYNDQGGAANWMLGVSLLGANTYLAIPGVLQELGLTDYTDFDEMVASAGWRLGFDTLGVSTYLSLYTYEQLEAILVNAYGYEVRIFGSISVQNLIALDLALQAQEPARSFHVIKTNLNLSDYGLVNTVNNVNAYSGVTCAYVDPTSSTGYTGVTT